VGTRIKVLVDIGALGYLSIAAHGHADALSLLMWIDDLEFLIDTGTYAYHTDAEWRAYFRGTLAHNTITIDGFDQSVPAGNFMWSQHATAEVLRVHEDLASAVVSGRHDGYGRLSDPVIHERTVLVDAVREEVVVTDVLRCRGEHDFDLRWHISELCDLQFSGDRVTLSREKTSVHVQCTGPHSGPTLLRGSIAPPAGWVSRRFGVREPCPTLSFAGRCRGDTHLITTFKVERKS
jgi:hypothetical protein